MKLLIINLLLWQCLSVSFSQNIGNGYVVYQKEELTESLNGINGFIQVLQDERFKSDEERDNWCHSELEYLKAILQIVDKNGKILFLEKFDFPVVSMDKTFLYNDNKPTFLITTNNWLGAGRETGHLTYFIEIENREMKFVVSKEGLQSSLSSDWKILNYKKEYNKQIFFIQSTFDSDLQNISILKRYYFDGKDWNCKEKSMKYDWWEKGEGEFPPLDLFP